MHIFSSLTAVVSVLTLTQANPLVVAPTAVAPTAVEPVPISPIRPSPPITVCPYLLRCCTWIGLASSPEATSALATTDLVPTNSSAIIGTRCYPIPIPLADEAIIEICHPVCCPIERFIPYDTTSDTTSDPTVADTDASIVIDCWPYPITGPIPLASD